MKKYFSAIFRLLENGFSFYGAYICLTIVITYLNYNNDTMSGILPYYLDFANFFESGFDMQLPFNTKVTTFPMWGYGFVLMITQHKFFIVVCQQLLSLIVIWYCGKIQNEAQWTKQSISVFRFIVLIGFGWMIFHTSLWPYSIAANFTILSLLILLNEEKNLNYLPYIISGTLMGVALNFRSDYIYYFYLFALIHFSFYLKTNRFKVKHSLVWAFTVAIFMTPWAMYTKARTNHYLMSSTNGGHVLYVSLGQLPSNCWGITCDDADPRMRRIIHGKSISSLSYESDIILKSEWKKNVLNNPMEYFKKCFYSTYLMIVRPFSTGEIYKKFAKTDESEKLKNNIKQDILHKNFGSLFSKLFQGKYFGFTIPVIINIIGILSFLFIYLILIYGFIVHRRKLISDLTIITFSSIIFYQMCLQILVLYNPNYHTNIYMFYALLCGYFINRTKGLEEKLFIKSL